MKRQRRRCGVSSPRCTYCAIMVGCVLVGTYTGFTSTSDIVLEKKNIDVPEVAGVPTRMASHGRKKRGRRYADGKAIQRPQALRQAKQQAHIDIDINVPATNYTFPHGIAFRPEEFFTVGDGKKYNNKTKLQKMGINNPSLKSMLSLTWKIDQHSDEVEQPQPRIPTFPQHMVFIHLRKAAGTTIENSMDPAKMMMNSTSNFFHPGIQATTMKLFPWRNRNSPERRKAFATNSNAVLESIQENLGNKHAKVFAVIRDPVSRFLSGVTQHLGMGLKKNQCIKSTARATVHCIFDMIADRGPQFNVHFVPMAVNLKAVLRGHDITVESFRMGDLPSILEQFGADPNTRENPGHDKTGVLSEINVNMLDADMIKTICQLYEIDIDMMHHLGWKVPYCDESETNKQPRREDDAPRDKR